MGWPHGKNIRDKILFGLVCKVVMEVQRSFIFFMYMGVTCKTIKGSYLFFNFINFFINSMLSFHVILFCFVLTLLFLHVMEKQESCMLNVNRNLSFASKLQKKKK